MSGHMFRRRSIISAWFDSTHNPSMTGTSFIIKGVPAWRYRHDWSWAAERMFICSFPSCHKSPLCLVNLPCLDLFILLSTFACHVNYVCPSSFHCAFSSKFLLLWMKWNENIIFLWCLWFLQVSKKYCMIPTFIFIQLFSVSLKVDGSAIEQYETLTVNHASSRLMTSRMN